MERRTPTVVSLTKELININTENPPGREIEAAKFIQGYLKGLGIESQMIEFEPSRANLIANIGKGEGMMLNGHIDTVPFPSNSVNKFATVQNGKVYGRGAADMKGGIASILASLEGINVDRFRRRLLLAFVADEESKFKGSRYLLEKRKGIFKDVKYGIIAEPSNLKIRIGQKGILGVKVGFTGSMAHGSSPWLGDNAIAKASAFVNDIGKTGEGRAVDTMARKDTMAITRINGGVAGNVIPDYCEVHIDRRIAPGGNTATALSQIRKLAKRHDPKACIDVKVAREPYAIDPKSKFVKMLKGITKAQTYYARTYTEAELYGRTAGIECVVYGPGESKLSHTPNEYVRMENLKRATNTFRSVIEKWCLQ
ncbi:MAG: M20 family metallopeptidase [Candidatus Micrarchaeales archaeon]